MTQDAILISPANVCIVTHPGVDSATLMVAEHDIEVGSIIQTETTPNSKWISTRYWRVEDLLGEIWTDNGGHVEIFLLREYYDRGRFDVSHVVQRHYIPEKGWRGFKEGGWDKYLASEKDK